MIRRHLLALLERLCPSIPPNLLAECIDEPAAVIPAQREPILPCLSAHMTVEEYAAFLEAVAELPPEDGSEVIFLERLLHMEAA